jgi:hypothetical protein
MGWEAPPKRPASNPGGVGNTFFGVGIVVEAVFAEGVVAVLTAAVTGVAVFFAWAAGVVGRAVAGDAGTATGFAACVFATRDAGAVDAMAPPPP